MTRDDQTTSTVDAAAAFERDRSVFDESEDEDGYEDCCDDPWCCCRKRP